MEQVANVRALHGVVLAGCPVVFFALAAQNCDALHNPPYVQNVQKKYRMSGSCDIFPMPISKVLKP
ncbi:hypothetical protein [Salinisphaera sp.]|uniref:hypothetical protein n=1 Tax=Salinisphaera sp. TaxID=1914330 RepID=UPI003C7BB92E